LDSVKAVVDEIVIVDTGSVDKTIEIAKSYTDKVYSYSWQGDFSAARNFAINQCSCEWILSLDADEWLEVAGHEFLREL
ncbi:glycosyltransferase, partial [Klebsiella pneumoniae]|nr:glycosyltransferase [Klebsiella pneumoniae]